MPSRRLLRDEVRDALRQAIVSGHFAPGERLDDTAIQQWLGVSRTPVRQAIAELVVEGFVETSPQSHTRVVNPDPADAPFVLDATGVLMSGVTRRAVVRLDAATRDEAVRVAEAVQNSCLARDRSVLATNAKRLFDILQRECGNPELVRLCASVSNSYQYRLAVTMGQGELRWDDFAGMYGRLAEAIEAGDDQEAGRIVDEIHAPAPA